ncbi:MAG: hypothetical protein Fur0011_2950 [Candidatus Microgenomates bacterium]
MTQELDPVALAQAATEVYGVFFNRIGQLKTMLEAAERIPENNYQVALLQKAIELAKSNFGSLTRHTNAHESDWQSPQ